MSEKSEMLENALKSNILQTSCFYSIDEWMGVNLEKFFFLHSSQDSFLFTSRQTAFGMVEENEVPREFEHAAISYEMRCITKENTYNEHICNFKSMIIQKTCWDVLWYLLLWMAHHQKNICLSVIYDVVRVWNKILCKL